MEREGETIAGAAPGTEGHGLYSIGTVARLTGVSEATLRNWERRFGIPQPTDRARGAHRLYTEAELARARFLAHRVTTGTPIRGAIALLRGGAMEPAALARQVLAAAQALDVARVAAALTEATVALTPWVVWAEVLGPALRTLGEEWAGSGGGIMAEHILSTTAAGWLRGLVAMSVTRPRIVIACGPGERHELGALALAALARECGLGAAYLGADTPEEALREARVSTGAEVLCVVATRASTARASFLALQRLLIAVPDSQGYSRLAGAGPGFASLSPEDMPPSTVALLGSDLPAAVAALVRLCGTGAGAS